MHILVFSQFEDESTLGRYEHISCITYVILLFKKDWTNVVCLITDNCQTNTSIASLQNQPLLGCASHIFNLSVNYFLPSDKADVIQKIKAPMSKLHTLHLVAKLRNCRPLHAKTNNYKRWSSVLSMLQRYPDIQKFLPRLESSAVDVLCHIFSENRTMNSLMVEL